MAKVSMFGVYDHVTGNVDCLGCYANSSQAARALVAMYAFSPHAAISKRLADYELVQITEEFDPTNTNDEIKHIFLFIGNFEKIKTVFDRRDGVFTLTSEEN